MSTRYHRVLLKLSGESLMGSQPFGIDPEIVMGIASQVKDVHGLGVEIGIVIGGGNIFRGLAASEQGFDRVSADHMGMLATVMNALAMQDALENAEVDTRVLSAIEMRQVAEPYIRRRAVRHLEKGRVVIFAAGTGNPYFSTDTTAALRAMEIKAQVIMKATRVNGIYDADPETVADAKMFPEISYLDVLTQGLRVMDTTAISLCMDNNLPIIVFNIKEEGNIKRVVLGGKDRLPRSVAIRPNRLEIIDMPTNAEIARVKERMGKAAEDLRRELASIRTGRASLSLFDNIEVDYYGVPTPVNQVATLAIPEPSLITLQAYDVSLIGAIEKAILASDLGLNPANDGRLIRVPIPPLNEERRQQLAKHVHKVLEDHRTAVRNIRRDGNETMKKHLKNKEMSEDDEHRALEEIQKLTDEYISKLEEIAKTKEEEILTV